MLMATSVKGFKSGLLTNVASFPDKYTKRLFS